jgi:hypothetical protein
MRTLRAKGLGVALINIIGFLLQFIKSPAGMVDQKIDGGRCAGYGGDSCLLYPCV